MPASQSSNLARAVQVSAEVGRLEIASDFTFSFFELAFELPAGGGQTGTQRCAAVANDLNNIVFSQPTNDLEFITPSFAHPADTVTWPNGAYALVYAIARCRDGCVTGFLDHQSVYEECIYTACQLSGCGFTYSQNAKSLWQKDLLYIRPEDQAHYGSGAPWDLALYFANQVRGLVFGRNFLNEPIPQLAIAGLNNYSGSTHVRNSDFYLAGETVNNPWTACFGGAERAHTCDLTIARDPLIPGLGCNTFVRITLGSRSVVARVTDAAQSGGGKVEGTAGGIGWALQVGSSACINRDVTIGPP